jgi:hypothetical protein
LQIPIDPLTTRSLHGATKSFPTTKMLRLH